MGVDISNLLRGKLQMLEEILELPNVFDAYDKLKNEVEIAEKGAK